MSEPVEHVVCDGLPVAADELEQPAVDAWNSLSDPPSHAATAALSSTFS